MSTYRFEALLTPRSVAVVGAGARAGSLGRAVFDKIRAGGFPGSVHPVHPQDAEADGVPCVARIADLPAVPDLAVVASPPESIPGIVAEAGRAGVRAAILLTAGLGTEPDDPGPRAARIAREHGLRLLGPDSAGLAVPGHRLDASLLARAPRAGDLALVSRSGTVAGAIVEWGARHGAGFSAVMALGSACDVDIADCLDHFANCLRTRAILLCLDGVSDARRFMSAARAAARTKPVVILRAGRHARDGRNPETHTGALARPDAVYAAAFRRAGLLAVEDLDAMFSAAETLSHQRPFAGKRLAILTNGRGIGLLAADRLADRGGVPADGPVVDLGITADGPAYAAALAPMLADHAGDAVLTVHVPTARSDAAAVAQAVADTVTRARRGQARKKPVFAVSHGEAAAAILAGAGIPHFATDSEAIEGFLHLVRYREAQDDLMRTPDSLPRDFSPDTAAAEAIVAAALRQGAAWLDPVAVAGLLAAYGIETVPLTLAPDIDAAAAAAWTIIAAGGTVALKVVSPDVVHKSDIGGVHLDLTSEQDVRDAARKILVRARRERPDARVTGFAVQPMVRKGQRRELIAGLAEDPVFGPVVVFGRGGTAVEVIDDRALGLPPLDLALADDLIGRTRVARRLAAYRDVPAVDRGAIALTLVKLAQLAADLPDVRELDINPLLADADGVVALDARVRLRASPRRAGGHPRFAIRPYPAEWVRALTLKGRAIAVRPVRPEDEPLFRAFFATIDPEDVRLRFFAPVRDFSHAFLARLTQLDYARAIAFVALDETEAGAGEGAKRMLGAVRLHANADGTSGEYAILVRSEARGTGLALALMRLMLDWARSEGIGTVEGTVLAENRAMLAVCRRLGFAQSRDPDDVGVVKVRLGLRG
ncbi:bifunctional acetate--CoA ligase family protein/GNAT family N-acetyltransferase [Methylobacterium sp. WL30]|uniref:bifunctional acetate--CoA ligase family protein/GNAT family N-acetyltransferase n=2 Tax=Methylobacterium TaxID=407 RepID=UPI0011C8A70C|nr:MULTISPECIES: bifunctional acetate--CoA ligase family protein/GNAT family N-acetyltransferase [unclassified Methylobacterium]TXN44606.1 bifunctional acetate--CoA ligase family protein/GNAT family N-acetyltransferase [Methylobacterium sp. WL119]TXN62888.1 bifunctional acetate--CoA ligase family protein/GNAT family N-acetyltransferase [Methylobacterium sp. WL30]